MADRDDVDIYASERELRARRWNWPAAALLSGAVLVVGAGYLVGDQLLWDFWERLTRKEVRARPITPSADLTALSAFSHPDPEPRTVYEKVGVPTDRVIRVEVPGPAPAPAPEPKPAPGFVVEPVTLQQVAAYHSAVMPEPPTIYDGTRPVEAWGCALRPGQEIKATLDHAVRWDLGGQIVATVREPVESLEAKHLGHSRVLIPAGAKLIGTADAERLTLGDDLAPAPRWQLAQWVGPDGMPRTVSLGDAQGANAAGTNGIGGIVEQPWGRAFATAALMTIFDVIGGTSINVGDGDSVTIRGTSAARVGAEMTRRSLDIRPKVFTPQGKEITLRATQAVMVCRR